MKFIFKILILIFFFTSLAQAQVGRFRFFEEMDECQKQGGVWHEFGNGCGDSCESKINKLPICTTALIYSCDCESDLCWSENKCVSLKSYQIAKAKKEAELVKIEDAKIKEEENKAFREKSGLGSIFSGTQKVFDYTKKEKDSILPEMPDISEIPGVTEIEENVKDGVDKITQTIPPEVISDEKPSDVRIPPAFLEMERKTKESLAKETQTKESQKVKEVTKEVAKDVKEGVEIDTSKTSIEPAFPSALPIPSQTR